MTEIKLGRIPHSLPRRSNSPRRNAVMTGAKTGALPIPLLNDSFPVFILGWSQRQKSLAKRLNEAQILVYVRECQFKRPFSFYKINGQSQKHSQKWLFPTLLP
jgi:hypothetical protein